MMSVVSNPQLLKQYSLRYCIVVISFWELERKKTRINVRKETVKYKVHEGNEERENKIQRGRKRTNKEKEQ